MSNTRMLLPLLLLAGCCREHTDPETQRTLAAVAGLEACIKTETPAPGNTLPLSHVACLEAFYLRLHPNQAFEGHAMPQTRP
jgi:hypothetical protein